SSFTVNSPFVGTFYRSASPDNPPFVEVGQVVKKGQVLCIVEAMKLMNEIEAEQPGRMLEVMIQNGSPVEYGEPLFRFEPVYGLNRAFRIAMFHKILIANRAEITLRIT